MVAPIILFCISSGMFSFLIIVQPEVMFVTAFRNGVCCILGVFYRSTAEQSHWFDGCLLLLLFAHQCHLHL